jgi:hypothetical protein
MIEVKKIFKIRNPSTGKFETLLAIKGEKGDTGSVDNIVQEFGDGEDLIVSQKVITEKFTTSDSEFNSLEQRVNNLETDILSEISNRSNDVASLQEADASLQEAVSLRPKYIYGSYKGSDTSSNKKTLTIEGVTELLMVVITASPEEFEYDSNTIYTTWSVGRRTLTWIKGVYRLLMTNDGDREARWADVTCTGNTITFETSYIRYDHDTSHSSYDLNKANTTYYYFALGI